MRKTIPTRIGPCYPRCAPTYTPGGPRAHRLASGLIPSEGAVPCGLLDNLIAYWPGNEAAGNALDAHTNGLDLTDNNTVTSNPGHVYALARQYTLATSEYHSRASEALLQTGDVDFTIAAWVYHDTVSTYQRIVAKDNSVAGEREYSLLFAAAGGGFNRFRLYVYRPVDAGVYVSADTLGEPSVNTWYFVVGWHDSVADTIYIQVNNGGVDSNATGGALQAASSAQFRIGAAQYPAAVHYMNGRIGPTAIWKSAAGGGGVLTAAQRTCLWNGGAGLAYADFT